MKNYKKAQPKAKIKTTDNRSKKLLSKNPTIDQKEIDKRFCLYVICGYLLLGVITWAFFSCPEVVKIAICLLSGLIISIILI